MIGVLVTFSYEGELDRGAVTGIAEASRERFEGLPGLRSKVFTVDESGREAVNVYVWESEEAARAFFTDELLERVTGLYGVRPTIRFVDVVTLVDNGARG